MSVCDSWPSGLGMRCVAGVAAGGLLLAVAGAALADADADGDEPYSAGGSDCDDRDPLLSGRDLDGDGFSSCEGDCADSDGATFPDRPPSSGFNRVCTPLLSQGAAGSWNERQVVQPSVLWDGSRYRMYYRGHYSASSTAFGVATSVNGRSWTNSALNPVFSKGATGTWDSFGIAGPWVVHDPDDPSAPWKLYYHAKDQVAGTRAIGLATSSNGYAWTRYGTGPVLDHGVGADYDAKSAHAPAVFVADGVYHMYYSAKDATSVYTIAHATSLDGGYTWTKDASPVLYANPGKWDSQRVSHVWAQPLGQGVQFLYSGANNTDFLAIGGGAGEATDDPWSRDSEDPYLWDGPPGAFDDAAVYGGQIELFSSGEWMFYGGLDAPGDTANGKIGRAVNWFPALSVDAVAAVTYGRQVSITGRVRDTAPETADVYVLDQRRRVLGWAAPDEDGWFEVVVDDWHGYKMWSVEVFDAGGLSARRDVSLTLSP